MTKSTSKQIPDFPPGDIQTDSQRIFFEMNGSSVVKRNRDFLIIVILGIALVLQGVFAISIFPLKTVETYQVNRMEGGRLVADGNPVGHWTPDQESLGYFINKWANSVYDVNSATIDGTTKESREWLTGVAIDQLKDLRIKDNPFISLQSNSSYTRTYEFKSINFVSDSAALLRFKTVTRKNTEKIETIYLMQISFTLVKPTTREMVMRNPAGLYITSFNVTEEVQTK